MGWPMNTARLPVVDAARILTECGVHFGSSVTPRGLQYSDLTKSEQPNLTAAIIIYRWRAVVKPSPQKAGNPPAYYYAPFEIYVRCSWLFCKVSVDSSAWSAFGQSALWLLRCRGVMGLVRPCIPQRPHWEPGPRKVFKFLLSCRWRWVCYSWRLVAG